MCAHVCEIQMRFNSKLNLCAEMCARNFTEIWVRKLRARIWGGAQFHRKIHILGTPKLRPAGGFPGSPRKTRTPVLPVSDAT